MDLLLFFIFIFAGYLYVSVRMGQSLRALVQGLGMVAAGIGTFIFVFWIYDKSLYDVFEKYIPVALVYGTAAACIFIGRKSLPKQSLAGIWLLTLTYFYSLATWDDIRKFILPLLLPVLILMALAGFSYSRLPSRVRWLLSVWVSIVGLLLGIPNLVLNFDKLLFDGDKKHFLSGLTLDSGLDLFLSGVLISYLTIAIVKLAPLLKDRRESFSKYLNRLDIETIPTLSEDVIEVNMPKVYLFLLTLIHCVPMFLNWFWGIPSFEITMMYLLIISPITSFFFLNALSIQEVL